MGRTYCHRSNDTSKLTWFSTADKSRRLACWSLSWFQMIQMLTQKKPKICASAKTWRSKSAECVKWGQKLCQLQYIICLEPEHAEPNQGLHHQIIMWDLHSSEIVRSIECQLLTDISGQPISPSFNGQEIQEREREVNWQNLMFWDFVRRIISSRRTMVQKPVLFLFSNLMDPLN